MHIKIYIPPPRKAEYKRYHPLPEKDYSIVIVPLSSISLKEKLQSFEYEAYDECFRQYINKKDRIATYWILASTVSNKWQEIHPKEYKRISDALEKLNLTESVAHNKLAAQVGLVDKILTPQNLSAIFRITVDDEEK